MPEARVLLLSTFLFHCILSLNTVSNNNIGRRSSVILAPMIHGSFVCLCIDGSCSAPYRSSVFLIQSGAHKLSKQDILPWSLELNVLLWEIGQSADGWALHARDYAQLALAGAVNSL